MIKRFIGENHMAETKKLTKVQLRKVGEFLMKQEADSA